MSKQGGGQRPYFCQPKFAVVMLQCVPVHYHVESIIPDSAITSGIFSGFSPSDVAESSQ